MLEPTSEQAAAYGRDGFFVLEEFLPEEEVERLLGRWQALFDHEWETGLAPDEVNYEPGVTPPDRTRQLCNVWKADRVVAATTLAERNASFAARLAGLDGVRIVQDNAIWKPPGGLPLLVHQDGAYLDFLSPPNMVTCWMALDDTHRDTGTIYYVRGSHRWPHGPAGGRFHAPDDWLSWLEQVRPAGAEVELVPVEVPAAGRRFTTPGSSTGAQPTRGAISSGAPSSATSWTPGRALTRSTLTRSTHATAGRARSRWTRPSSRCCGGRTATARLGSPVTWLREARSRPHRSPWLAGYVAS